MDWDLYKARHLVENAFTHLKRFENWVVEAWAVLIVLAVAMTIWVNLVYFNTLI